MQMYVRSLSADISLLYKRMFPQSIATPAMFATIPFFEFLFVTLWVHDCAIMGISVNKLKFMLHRHDNIAF